MWSSLLWVGVALALSCLAVFVLANLLPPRRELVHRLAPEFAVGDPAFLRVMSHLLGPPLVGDHRIETLVNGDRIFPAMLAAIRAAECSVTFETFIYWSGATGEAFSEALAERARAGIGVHVLLDWVGSQKMDETLLARMRDAGVELERFRRPRWRDLGRLNNRTHRKLLVVDGRIGFTGGVGIADQWRGDARGEDEWRDTHYRIEGAAVAQMQAAFIDNWLEARGELPTGEGYFPELAPAGDVIAQMFKSSPFEGSENMELMYLLAIACARESIRLSVAYFVPDGLSLAMLEAACRRGVRLEIIVPNHHIDEPLVRRASRGRWGPILAAGGRIFEFQPTMYHCKSMIVDDIWVSVGSTNFDSRSFRLNDEANLNVCNRAFAAEQRRLFEADLRRAREITHAEWSSRPRRERLQEWCAGLLRKQL